MHDLNSRIKNIYQQHLEVISPLMMQLEIYDAAFPVEILNEIRAIFTHLAKSSVADSVDDKEKNVNNAESHLKRAILDCFKYSCMSLDDRYKKFEEQYKCVDLSLVSDGEFLRELLRKRDDAEKKLLDARKTDLEIKHDANDLQEAYQKYEAAFCAYGEVDNMIIASYTSLQNVKKKALFKDRLAIASFVIGVVGLIIGAVSLLS